MTIYFDLQALHVHNFKVRVLKIVETRENSSKIVLFQFQTTKW